MDRFFNIEAAKRGKKVTTMDNRRVEFTTFFASVTKEDVRYPIVATLHDYRDKTTEAMGYTEEGRPFDGRGRDSWLIMADLGTFADEVVECIEDECETHGEGRYTVKGKGFTATVYYTVEEQYGEGYDEGGYSVQRLPDAENYTLEELTLTRGTAPYEVEMQAPDKLFNEVQYLLKKF